MVSATYFTISQVCTEIKLNTAVATAKTCCEYYSRDVAIVTRVIIVIFCFVFVSYAKVFIIYRGVCRHQKGARIFLLFLLQGQNTLIYRNILSVNFLFA